MVLTHIDYSMLSKNPRINNYVYYIDTFNN